MGKKDNLTKFLAVAGTVLVWIPFIAPVFFSLAFLIRSGRFHFDYLMPAELSLVALAGALILIWASSRARMRLKIILWGLGIAIFSLAASQGLAVITGLAHGDIEPTGWQWAIVIALLVVYILSVIVIGIGGILLVRDLHKRKA